jgi:uncharacterized protein (TIGR02145 family)
MNKIVAMLMLLHAACFAQNTFTDSRDGKKYKYVKIGEQTWMAENLNYNAKGSKCGGTTPKSESEGYRRNTYYLLEDKNTVNCNKYGRLYDWNAVLKACPKGWHLPSNEEWQELVNFAGQLAGMKLQAEVVNDEDGGGTDEYGFSALPGGYGDSNGNFYDVGICGDWWSATEYDASNAYYRYMGYYDPIVFGRYGDKSTLLSVRCMRD